MLSRSVLASLPVVVIVLSACGPTPDQLNNSGHSPYASDDYGAALDAYEAARDRAPEAAEPLYNLGNTQYRMGNFQESLEKYDQSLKYGKGEMRSHGFFNRGNAAFQRQQYAQAVEAYKEVLRMDPDDTDAKHNLELALRQMPPQDEVHDQESPQTQPPPQAETAPQKPQTEPLTGDQARQALEAVGESAQTLQERRRQTLVSPSPQTEFDW